MKKLLLLTLGVALLGAPGWAAICAPGTLASYIALGSAGCVLGDLTVTGFSYQAKASGGAAKITADQIDVTPLLAPTSTVGLQFAAPWDVQMGQAQQSGISYKVLSAGTTVQIQQARLDGSGFKAGALGSVTVIEALATLATTSSLDIYLKCTDTCSSQTSELLTFTPPAVMLFISDQVQLQSKQGSASMANFADWFVVAG
jgi:hypothetical protein